MYNIIERWRPGTLQGLPYQTPPFKIWMTGVFFFKLTKFSTHSWLLGKSAGTWGRHRKMDFLLTKQQCFYNCDEFRKIANILLSQRAKNKIISLCLDSFFKEHSYPRYNMAFSSVSFFLLISKQNVIFVIQLLWLLFGNQKGRCSKENRYKNGFRWHK